MNFEQDVNNRVMEKLAGNQNPMLMQQSPTPVQQSPTLLQRAGKFVKDTGLGIGGGAIGGGLAGGIGVPLVVAAGEKLLGGPFEMPRFSHMMALSGAGTGISMGALNGLIGPSNAAKGATWGGLGGAINGGLVGYHLGGLEGALTGAATMGTIGAGIGAGIGAANQKFGSVKPTYMNKKADLKSSLLGGLTHGAGALALGTGAGALAGGTLGGMYGALKPGSDGFWTDAKRGATAGGLIGGVIGANQLIKEVPYSMFESYSAKPGTYLPTVGDPGTAAHVATTIGAGAGGLGLINAYNRRQNPPQQYGNQYQSYE